MYIAFVKAKTIDRIFSHSKFLFFKEKIRKAIRVFPSLCRAWHITLYYVNAVGSCVVPITYLFTHNRDADGDVGRKEIKNELGVLNERRSRTNGTSGTSSKVLSNNKSQLSKRQRLKLLLNRSYDLKLPFGNVPMLPPAYFRRSH